MVEFKLPDLGEGVAEGQIVSVLVKEGDEVAEFQPMMEVETDKAAVEIPSPTSGVVKKIHAAQGDTVQVGAVLVTIDDGAGGGGDDTEAAPRDEQAATSQDETRDAEQESQPSAREPVAADATARSAARSGIKSDDPAPTGAPSRGDGPIPAAPAVRKLAREKGVDLASVTPTGPRGRVMREDVERAALSADGGALPDVAPQRDAAPAKLPESATQGQVRREPASQIRKTIAKAMTQAWLNVPRVTASDDADITDLEAARKTYNKGLGDDDVKLGMTAIITKAVAATLRQHPKLNCSYDAANDEIVYKDFVNVGIAVDTPRGLVVPVLKDADRKPLRELAAEMNDLIGRTRAAKFDISEIRGGTFTITNLGPLGGTYFSPMVNFPEVAILGLGRSLQRAVVRDGQIVPRLILPLSLSYDHRIVDGADGARFTTDLIKALENPLHLISVL
jgi:pyruvate dehydrogenase E2 component (dihydrolipoamide acetyltransferase)